MTAAILLPVIWASFIVVWIVTAIGAKPSVRGINWRREGGIRLIIILAVLIVLRVHPISASDVSPTANAQMAAIGVIVAAIGIGLAIYARLNLGKNWGMPMTIRQDPKLVTSGPYRLIRHPIYSGLLISLVGTTIATTWLVAIPLIIIAAYFIYAATSEEKIMARTFPDTYPAYKAKSKMLIPFIF